MCHADPAHPTDEAIEYYFRPLVSTARGRDRVHAYAVALERNPLLGIEAALRRCKVPTRIVWGTGDTIFSPESPDKRALLDILLLFFSGGFMPGRPCWFPTG